MEEYYVKACEVEDTEGETEYDFGQTGCMKWHARNLRATRKSFDQSVVSISRANQSLANS